MEDLLKVAQERELTAKEVKALSMWASNANRATEIVLGLLRANTVAARANVLHLRSLATRFKPKEQPRSSTDGTTTPPVGPFGLSHHAVERYIERYGQPGEDPALTQARLYEEMRNASPIRERTHRGTRQWVSPSGVVFVVKYDPGGRTPTCVTILPKGAREVAA